MIAFISRGPDIWVIPTEPEGVATQITTDPARDYQPAWSPDGAWIAWQSDRSGNYEIWIIDAPVPVEPTTWGAVKVHFR
jgi:Tol biopolymer transport system component